jgi:hypothetical protein
LGSIEFGVNMKSDENVALVKELKLAIVALLERSPHKKISRFMPGYVAGYGDAFFPVYVPVEGRYSHFRVCLPSAAKPGRLMFSKVVFAGQLGGEGKLLDLAEYAECSQSSNSHGSGNVKNGLHGPNYANNVKTDVEAGPWWQATFPSDVHVSQVYLFRRFDRSIVGDVNLQIQGMGPDGDWVTLWRASPTAGERKYLIDNLLDAVDALLEMSNNLIGETKQSFDAAVSGGLKEYLALIQVGENGRRAQGNFVKSGTLSRIADELLKAMYEGLGGAKDFGQKPDEALEIALDGETVSELRFRTFGELPRGLKGAEIYAVNLEDPIMRLDENKLKFHYVRPPYASPTSYRRGLVCNIRSRRVDLGGEFVLDRIRAWAPSVQDSGNSLFLEVSGRNTPNEPWRVLYDHGAPFRQVSRGLRLIDALVKDEWTEHYGRLVGKLFTQYRRRAVVKPMGKFTRDNKIVHAAVFEGSNKIATNNGFASPLKLGKHGLGVPVAFRNQKQVMEHMTAMRDRMTEIGYPPLLMYGTLLGAIREKDFIPHDDDVDLAVILENKGPEELATESNKLIEVLKAIGIRATSGGGKEAPLIHVFRGHITYDVFVLGHKGGTIYWPHKALKVVPVKADIFLPTKKIVFKGETFDGPADPAAVCEARYGPDWRIPNPAFEW